MQQRGDRIRLQHMLDAAREAFGFAWGKTRDALRSDRMFAFSSLYLLLTVGEAAARVSAETRARYPAIPWVEVVGMRNHLVHGYDQIEYDTVWRALTEDLPPLVAELERILATKE
jgi:uncharacterized protein with HEPN domain